MTQLRELRGLPSWARFDGPTFDAFWKARVAKPKTFNELCAVPGIEGLPKDTQLEIWALVHPTRKR